MPEEQSPAELSHIAIEREPDVETERRRRRAAPPPPRIAGRLQHGNQIAASVSSVATTATIARQQAGVDPSRLLVVEFTSLGAAARDVFEARLNAVVVDENNESRRVTRILAVSAHGDSPDDLARRIAGTGTGDISPAPIAELRLRRANKGDVDKAIRMGAVIEEALARNPTSMIVVETTSWGAEKEEALQSLGISPVAQSEETTDLTRMLVQFPSLDAVRNFEAEARHYVSDEEQQTALPPAIRRSFFDALEWAGSRSRNDRTGARLRQEGFPEAAQFALDVDLWHPGTRDGALAILNELRGICQRLGGRVIEDLRTSSLVLARVEANHALGEALLNLDIVAQVNLPPVLPAAYASLFDDVPPLPDHAAPDGTEPMVTVVDSGVLAGHPLLRGWILDERDFDSGENTVVDRQGHGTQVAGLVVYGDVARCLETRQWNPRVMVASAKVLRRDPIDESRVVFPENHRPERIVEDAIRHFHRERGCRVFNLSVGNADDIYAGGRQFAWAEALDQLARELDVVLIISAGNISTPPWPQGVATREQFQSTLRDLLLRARESRLCNPATAAIAVSVGAISRSARTNRHVFVAAPEGAPAPFSRLGPGYEPKNTQRAVKPEFVSFGGNYAVENYDSTGPSWVRNDIQLGEPTTRLNTDGGRPLTAVSGTSFAAPQVSFAAAFALQSAAGALGVDAPTANAARALLGACAEMPPCERAWLLDPEDNETWDKLRMVGYGQVDVRRVVRSLQNDVCLLAEDRVAEDHWHLYAVRVPPAFIGGQGNRGITVSLAFDPPVRASRRDYLSRTMWVEVLKGLTPEEIAQYRARHTGDGIAASLPQSKILAMRPAKTDVGWSTLQVRRCSWTRAPSLPAIEEQGEPTLHVLVQCQRRFPSGEDENQRYALAIRLWHTDTQIELHQQLRSRIRARVVTRLRVERRG